MSSREVVTAPDAPEAAGPYVHGTVHAGVLYCAGQVPLDPASMELVGGDLGVQATRCLENLDAVCRAAGTSLRDGALRLTVYTTDLARGPEINAAYAAYFEGADAPPARAMIGVAALPLGAEVEIDAIVALH